MNNALSVLLTASIAAALSPMAIAQSPAGTYVVTNPDGSPPVPGRVCTVVVSHLGPVPGIYTFVVLLDGVPVAGEEGFIYTDGFWSYNWVNARGTTGTLTGNSTQGFESVVTSGPNRGAERCWRRV